MKNAVEFIIALKDNASAGLARFQRGVKAMSSGVGNALRSIGRASMGFGLVFGALAAQIALSVREAAKLEKAMRPFERHMGGRAGAREHVGDLRFLSRSYGTHSSEELMENSRTLLNASDGKLGDAKDMRLLGDMSAATGNSLDQVTGAVASFYQQLKQGQGVDRAAKQLEGLGLISSGVIPRLKVMQAEGASSADMWRTVSGEFNRFAGGMESDSTLAGSSISRLRENTKQAMQNMGASFLHGTKHIDNLSNWIEDLVDSGALEKWAENVSQALDLLLGWIGKAIDGVRTLIGWGRNALEWSGSFIRYAAANIEDGYKKGGLKGGVSGLFSGSTYVDAGSSATSELQKEIEDRRAKREAAFAKRRKEREDRKKRLGEGPGLTIEGIKSDLDEADAANRFDAAGGSGGREAGRDAGRTGSGTHGMNDNMIWDAYYAWRAERSGPQGLEGSNAFKAIESAQAFSRFGRNKEEVRRLREVGAAKRRVFVENAALAHRGFKNGVMDAVSAGDRVISTSENDHVELQGRGLNMLEKIEQNTRGGGIS